MRVTYFYRSLKCGFSIKKVFNTISHEVSKNHEVREYYIPAHRADLMSVLKNIFYVFKQRDKYGINHITGDVHYCILALIGCKSVLTIHDLSAFECAGNPIKRSLLKLLWFRLPLLLADKIVCISEHTRTEVSKITKRKDIIVIYNAVDPLFKVRIKQFNVLNPRILQIGTAWNKNLVNTIKALISIPCHLVIIGSVEASVLNLLSEKKISFVIKTNLTDNQLIEEYQNCDIVSFCSIYEGFGMPIIEANAVGRCVITSDISPMNEIAADAACIIDPNNVLSIKKGFIKIISEENFRNSLINNGTINIERFNVDDISRLYINLYSKLYSKQELL